MSNFLDNLNHPLLFLIAVTIGVVAMQAALAAAFGAVGWKAAQAVFSK
jgi:hypothetical protein